MKLGGKTVVAMADMRCVKYPGVLITFGLGSCVAIALYDSTTKTIGLAHCMLPTGSISTGVSAAKFVDTAVPQLVDDMRRLGVKRSSLVAKLAGGAQMHKLISQNETMRIGARNIKAAHEALAGLRIPVIGEDVGGTCGRSAELHSDSGSLIVKTAGKAADKKTI